MTSVSYLRNETAPTRACPQSKRWPILETSPNRAGVSVATASRVASGSADRAPGDARPRRTRDARPPLRPPGPCRGVECDRALRARVREPRLRRTRRGDGDARGPERASRRSSATPHGSADARASTTCTCSSSAASRGWCSSRAEVTDVRGEHSPLPQAARARRAARLRQRRLGGSRRDVGRRRRARRRPDRDRAPHRARPRRIGFVAGHDVRAADAREDARPRRRAPGGRARRRARRARRVHGRRRPAGASRAPRRARDGDARRR